MFSNIISNGMNEKLTAEKRTKTGTKACKVLREAGKMPGVVYSEGKEASMITLDTKEFGRVWKLAGETSVITLEGEDGEKSVLVQDVDFDPLYDTPLHADFYEVSKDRTVTVDVPLTFTGIAPAEKELGGSLVKVMREMTVEALPANLPKEIMVDISCLKTFEDQLLIKNIALPDGVTATEAADEVVALVQAAHEETEESSATDISSVQVEKKGKEESEGTE